MSFPSTITPELEAELRSVAEKVFWWGRPEDALRDQTRFVAQVMTYGDWNDVKTTLRLLGEHAFELVLDNPPTGVFDIKSWTYWHLYLGRKPIPPLPQRQL